MTVKVGYRRPLPVLASDRSHWAERALCRGYDPELFFPHASALADLAKSVCARCPVRRQCADYALTTGQEFGVWGGMSEEERRREIRVRNRAAALKAVAT